jgi:urease accessory protein
LPRLESVIGTVDDPELADRLHHLSHTGRVETITLAQDDMGRRRLRARSDAGTDYAIVLARDQALRNGAVLYLDDERAVVVRLQEQRWLTLEPDDLSIALQLGYHAGNMHWRVRFEGDRLKIALDGEEAAYLARLEPLLSSERIRIVDE